MHDEDGNGDEDKDEEQQAAILDTEMELSRTRKYERESKRGKEIIIEEKMSRKRQIT